MKGDIISGGEELTVKVIPSLYHIALEARGAIFKDAQCNAKRTTKNSGILVIPNTIMEDVSVVCAWAKSYIGGVKVSTPFVFQLQQVVNADSTENVIMVV